MMRALRVASLFMVYAGLGWAGDQAVAALLAEDEAQDERVFTRVDVRVEPDVDVDVDVQVRTSGECAFEVDRRVAFVLDGTLEIAAGAGSLRVEGDESATEVVAVGRACASSRELLDALELTADGSGGDVQLSAHYPERRWGRGEASIDLVVTVPLGAPVRIADSSGEIVTSGTGDLRIQDSSGSIEVRSALGAVQIQDGSGDIEVEGATGDVDISDGSGGIDVRGVAGSVAVRDGSGGIDIAEIGGDVVVEADGSGGIDVRDVAGDFTVDRDGSGGIRYSGVAGRVDVPTRDR
jgi:hypothetical protein